MGREAEAERTEVGMGTSEAAAEEASIGDGERGEREEEAYK
jgi:hypothetical protein